MRMKQIILLLALAAIASCAPKTNSPAADSSDTQATEAVAGQEQTLLGGYTEQREPTEEELDIFRHVTGESEMTLNPLSVSTQVVAGLNYKFWCRYEDSAHDASGHCWVIIYRDLQGNATLTSIEKEY